MHDLASMAAGMSRPGADTRQWASFGTVVKETSEAKAVRFEDGQPFVDVKLHPSGVEVPCRVAAAVAGNGEGEWFPFIEGDEVIVLVPRGSERAGCTVIGRLNNEIDAFPEMVAGQKVDGNNFAFRRLRTPYILETASSYLVRSATTEAFFSMSATGEVTLSNSDKAFFTLSHDHLTLQNGDGDMLVQVDVKAKQVRVEAQGAKFMLDAANDSLLMVPSRLMVGTSGNMPLGHAVTLEQVVVLLQSLFIQLGATFAGPLLGASVAAAAIPLLNTALPAAAVLPLAPVAGGVTAALQVPPVPNVSPGCGVAGFLIG